MDLYSLKIEGFSTSCTDKMLYRTSEISLCVDLYKTEQMGFSLLSLRQKCPAFTFLWQGTHVVFIPNHVFKVTDFRL